MDDDSPAGLARDARALFEGQKNGVLATLTPQDGYPYTSLVEYAPLPDGDALLFLSSLAEHRRFLEADPRASLWVGPAGAALDQARLSLRGRVLPAPDRDALAPLYLGAHPEAERYIDFGDFAFFRLRVERARFIAGFGRMGWIEGDSFREAP